MKKFIPILFFTFLALNTVAQLSEFRVKYYINQNKKFKDNVYFKIKDTIVTYEKGWTETKKIGNRTFDIVLDKDISDTFTIYKAVNLNSKWKVGEVKFTDEDPSKVFFNPWSFKDSLDPIVKKLNQTGYISVSNNSWVTLRKTYFSISAFTMPFAVRFKLNDSIRSLASTNLNLGVGISHNTNWVRFKNRRIKAAMTSYGFSYGLGLGFTAISLDKNNTILSTAPLTQGESGLAFTIAPGIGLNLNGLHITCFYAWDLALTSNIRKWNYHNKGYLGLGLGVNLSTLGNLTK